MKNILFLLFAFLAGQIPAMEFGKTDVPQIPQSNALHEAVRKNNKELVQQLIAQGANVNAFELVPRGNTPLCLAADCGHLELMKLLIKAGAEVNAIVFYENTGYWNRMDTILMRVVSAGCLDSSKLLLEHGANPLIYNKYEETVFDLLKKILAKKDVIAQFQREAYREGYTDILNRCHDSIKNYKKMYKELLLIQQKTSNPSPLQVIPRDMINHILWILTGLLCSQVSQFKP